MTSLNFRVYTYKMATQPLMGIKREAVKVTCQVGQEDACDDHQLHTGAQQPPHSGVGDFRDIDLLAVKRKLYSGRRVLKTEKPQPFRVEESLSGGLLQARWASNCRSQVSKAHCMPPHLSK